jgi:hypothetical protein
MIKAMIHTVNANKPSLILKTVEELVRWYVSFPRQIKILTIKHGYGKLKSMKHSNFMYKTWLT